MAILRRSSSFWAADSSSSTRLSLLLCAINISKSSVRFNFLSSFSVTVVPPFPCFRDVPGKRTPAETILFYALIYTMINLFKQVISLIFQERKRFAPIFTLVHRKFTI